MIKVTKPKIIMGGIIAWGFFLYLNDASSRLYIYCLDKSHVRMYVLSPNYIRAWIFNMNMNNSHEEVEEAEGLFYFMVGVNNQTFK